MSRSQRSRCSTSRQRCGTCTDSKQAHRRASEVEPRGVRLICTCGWITARPVCPICGLRPLTDLTGRMYGRLTVLHREGSDRSCMPLWRCRCACGATVRVRGNSLKQGLTRSCGCLRSEVSSGLMREIWRRRAA